MFKGRSLVATLNLIHSHWQASALPKVQGIPNSKKAERLKFCYTQLRTKLVNLRVPFILNVTGRSWNPEKENMSPKMSPTCRCSVEGSRWETYQAAINDETKRIPAQLNCHDNWNFCVEMKCFIPKCCWKKSHWKVATRETFRYVYVAALLNKK